MYSRLRQTASSLTILLLMVSVSFAAPPARTQTYTAGETILSSDVTENEDNIFNYLQAGVDTIKDDTIVNADVNSSANIQSDKLNLTAIAQDVGITSGGSFDNNGATTLDGSVGITGALTVTGNSTFSGTTIADVGTITTGVATFIDITDSRIASATMNLGSDQTGDVYYNNGTKLTRLGLGSASQVLSVNSGVSAPEWATITQTNTSNVLFSWSGNESYGANNSGTALSTSLAEAANSSNLYNIYWYSDINGSYVTMATFQFTKISTIDTVTIHARTWSENSGAGSEAFVKVDIGGQNNEVKSVTSTSPSWVSTATIDVSGLSDGTTYDGIVQLKSEDGSAVYCSAVTLIGS